MPDSPKKWTVLFIVHAVDDQSRYYSEQLFTRLLQAQVFKQDDQQSEQLKPGEKLTDVRVFVLRNTYDYSDDTKTHAYLWEIEYKKGLPAKVNRVYPDTFKKDGIDRKSDDKNKIKRKKNIKDKTFGDMNDMRDETTNKNLGNSNTLKKIMNQVKELVKKDDNDEERNLMLFTWDHGCAFGIFDPDEYDKDDTRPIKSARSTDMLMMKELANAIKNKKPGSPAERARMLVMMNCWMQSIETNYELKDCVDVLVAPETSIDWLGYNYEAIIKKLADDAKGKKIVDDEYLNALGTSIVKSTPEMYINNNLVPQIKLDDLILSATRPGSVGAIAGKIEDLVNELSTSDMMLFEDNEEQLGIINEKLLQDIYNKQSQNIDQELLQDIYKKLSQSIYKKLLQNIYRKLCQNIDEKQLQSIEEIKLLLQDTDIKPLLQEINIKPLLQNIYRKLSQNIDEEKLQSINEIKLLLQGIDIKSSLQDINIELFSQKIDAELIKNIGTITNTRSNVTELTQEFGGGGRPWCFIDIFELVINLGDLIDDKFRSDFKACFEMNDDPKRFLVCQYNEKKINGKEVKENFCGLSICFPNNRSFTNSRFYKRFYSSQVEDEKRDQRILFARKVPVWPNFIEKVIATNKVHLKERDDKNYSFVLTHNFNPDLEKYEIESKLEDVKMEDKHGESVAQNINNVILQNFLPLKFNIAVNVKPKSKKLPVQVRVDSIEFDEKNSFELSITRGAGGNKTGASGNKTGAGSGNKTGAGGNKTGAGELIRPFSLETDE